MDTVIIEEIEERIKDTDSQLAATLNQVEQLRDQKIELLQRKVYIEMHADLYAKTKQTMFTKKELCERWRCSRTHFDNIKRVCELKPVDKLGQNFVYNIEAAEQAKADFREMQKAGAI